MALEDYDLSDEPSSIGRQLLRSGVTRRQFLEFCVKLMAVAPFGLLAHQRANAAEVAPRSWRRRSGRR